MNTQIIHGEASFSRSSAPSAYPEAIKTSPTSIFESDLGLMHLSPFFMARTHMPVSSGMRASRGSVQFWLIAVPVFIAFIAIMAIGAWIGLTMATTPPPKPIEEITKEMEEKAEEKVEGEKPEEKPATEVEEERKTERKRKS